MATLIAHIRVHPGKEAEFESIARALYRATHDNEAAVGRYEYWRGNEPGTYYTLLSYPDFQTFIAHQTSAHHEAASPQLKGVVESIRLEWLDPVTGANELPRTAHQEPPADADELTRAYSDRYAAQIAEWWGSLR